MKKLADANIHLTALQAISSGAGRYGAIFWVKFPDFKKARQALGLEDTGQDAAVVDVEQA